MKTANDPPASRAEASKRKTRIPFAVLPQGAAGGEDLSGIAPGVEWQVRDLVLTVDAYAAATNVDRPRVSATLFTQRNRVDLMASDEVTLTITKFNEVMGRMARQWPDAVARPPSLLRWEAERARARSETDAGMSDAKGAV